jgi:hypothetical protein
MNDPKNVAVYIKGELSMDTLILLLSIIIAFTLIRLTDFI